MLSMMEGYMRKQKMRGAWKNALGILALFLCIACLAPGVALAETEPDFRERGVTVTASPYWKPYSFIDERGHPDGFFIDYWEKWSEKTGVPVHFRLVSWGDTIKLIADGECDIQSGLYFTEERARLFDFSTPVFYSKGVLVTRSDIPCELDLSSYTWGGVAGTEEKAYAEELSGQQEILSFENSRDLFSALVANRIQATVDDWSTVMLLGNEMGLQDQISICRTVYERDLQAIVLKGREDLLRVVNEGIAAITEDEKRFLINKWFIGEKKGLDWQGMRTPVVIGCLLLLLVWLIFVTRSKN